jgi:pyruvoyl-dependent arginine decarboxylase (PvlArgDC)
MIQRTRELQKVAVQKAGITVEGLIAEAATAQQRAMELGQMSACVAALTAKAKIAGTWIERAETENKNVNENYAISDAPMSEEECNKQMPTSDRVRAPSSEP